MLEIFPTTCSFSEGVVVPIPTFLLNVPVVNVLVADTRSEPEAETLPALSTKNNPAGFPLEVATKKLLAVRVEVVEPSETVTAVVKLEPAAPPPSVKQVNLPVEAS